MLKKKVPHYAIFSTLSLVGNSWILTTLCLNANIILPAKGKELRFWTYMKQLLELIPNVPN